MKKTDDVAFLELRGLSQTAEDRNVLRPFTTERTMFQIGLPPCRVDFLTSVPGLEFESAFAARKLADIGDLLVPLVSLSDLIVAKRASGREQDLRDLDGLERIVGGSE